MAPPAKTTTWLKPAAVHKDSSATHSAYHSYGSTISITFG